MSKRVAISQSNYIPWKGYFDLLGSVDELMLYDEVQYTRRDWRNRNKIKTPSGLKWLTIPVQAKGKYHQRIDETLITGTDWAANHLATLRHMYAGTPHFATYLPGLEALYGAPAERLSDVNRAFITWIVEQLGFTTTLTWSTDYEVPTARAAREEDGDATELLAALSEAAGASTYVSGPAAKAYMQHDRFDRRGIAVEYFDYGPYPEYEQPHPPFEHAVTVLDLLFCTGPDARAHLRAAAGPRASVG
jgi:WbqC-like protein family